MVVIFLRKEMKEMRILKIQCNRRVPIVILNPIEKYVLVGEVRMHKLKAPAGAPLSMMDNVISTDVK
jgi:hypothetical protein